jgi:hypothetical protein
MVETAGVRLAAIGESERTQKGTAVGAIGEHGVSGEKDQVWYFEKSRRGEAQY